MLPLLAFLFLTCIPNSFVNAASFNLHKDSYFKGIRYAEQSGIVRRAFKISVPGVLRPYNPSIVAYKGGYLLAFRHDPPWDGVGVFNARIGLIELDHTFSPRSEKPTFLRTKGKNAEDPRLFQVGGETYVSYTRMRSFSPTVCNIAVSRIDPEHKKVIHSTDMLYKKALMEKNWTPFVYAEGGQKERVYFMYAFSPQRVLRLTLPLDGTVSHVCDNKAPRQLKKWKKKWGTIRGGTPAIRAGDEYISFFHSVFVSKNVRYYVMGAIAFEARFPFRITRISPYPIFFRGIYETPPPPHAWFSSLKQDFRVLFASGVVEGEEEGRKVYYVVCGENDAAIKCVALNKERLWCSLKRAH